MQLLRHSKENLAAVATFLSRHSRRGDRITGRARSFDPSSDRVLQVDQCLGLRIAVRRTPWQVGRSRNEPVVLITPEHLGGVTVGVRHSSSSYLSIISINCLACYVGILPSFASWKFKALASPEREKATCWPFPPEAVKPSQRATLQASSNRTSLGLFRIAARSFLRELPTI